MTHDVSLLNKSIERDYGMVVEDINIGTPAPRVSYVAVPGRDGILDYSEAIAGRITYGTRPIKMSLVAEGLTPEAIDATKDALISDIHGKKITLSPGWQEGYYTGRTTVEVEDYRPNFVRLNVEMDADPYRIAEEDSTVEVEVANTSQTARIQNGGDKPVQLEVTVRPKAGQNMLLDTVAPTLTKVNAPKDRTLTNPSNGSIVGTWKSITNPPATAIKYGVEFNVVSTPATTSMSRIWWYSSASGLKLVEGQTYTISCYARVSRGSGSLGLQYYNGTTWKYNYFTVSSSEWTRITYTFTCPSNSDCGVCFTGRTTLDGTFEVCGFKVEEGSTATAWANSPAVQATISDGTSSYTYGTGKVTLPTVVDGKSSQNLTVEGYANVEFKWREGYL